MKTCDHIRPILLTDYLDDELDKGTKKRIEEHLANCPGCSLLVTMAKEDISIISDEAAKKKVPPYLWRSIMNKIEDEKRAGNAVADFVRGFIGRLTMPKLAPALVGMILLVLSVSFFIYTQHIGQDYGNENFAYVSELFTNGGSPVTTEHEGLGTPIEEYFL